MCEVHPELWQLGPLKDVTVVVVASTGGAGKVMEGDMSRNKADLV